MHRDIESKAAVDSFAESIKLASLRQLPIVDLIDCAARMTSVGQEQSSAELYKTWIAHNADNDLLHAVYFNYGVVLMAVGDRAGAINAYRESIRLKPDFYPPHQPRWRSGRMRPDRHGRNAVA